MGKVLHYKIAIGVARVVEQEIPGVWDRLKEEAITRSWRFRRRGVTARKMTTLVRKEGRESLDFRLELPEQMRLALDLAFAARCRAGVPEVADFRDRLLFDIGLCEEVWRELERNPPHGKSSHELMFFRGVHRDPEWMPRWGAYANFLKRQPEPDKQARGESMTAWFDRRLLKTNAPAVRRSVRRNVSKFVRDSSRDKT